MRRSRGDDNAGRLHGQWQVGPSGVTFGGGPYAIAAVLADPVKVRAVGLAAGIGPWRLIEPSHSEDPDLPLLAMADAGDVAGALKGFRALGRVAYDRLLELEDDDMVEEFFEDAPRAAIGWHDAEPKTLGLGYA